MNKTVPFLKEGELGEMDEQMIIGFCPLIKGAQSALSTDDKLLLS